MEPVTRLRFLVVALAATVGCSNPLDMGSEVIWSARHESGDLSEWEEGGQGRVLSPTVELASDRAHSGQGSLRLSNVADRLDVGPCVTREFEALPEAYQSAWYLIPEIGTTLSSWTLLRFRSRPPALPAGEGGAANDVGAPGGAGGGGPAGSAGALGTTPDPAEPSWFSVVELGARSLPDGGLVLYLFSHDRSELLSPVAVPAPRVPVGRWFHLEVLYRPGPDGGAVVWLDGARVYGVTGRSYGETTHVGLAVCNLGRLSEPVDVFVDDVVVSRARTTPTGSAAR